MTARARPQNARRAGGRAVIEVMLHEATHALAAVRAIKDTSAEGHRYHNKRFAARATELGLRGPEHPGKVTGWSTCQITSETTTSYTGAIAAIDTGSCYTCYAHFWRNFRRLAWSGQRWTAFNSSLTSW